MKQTSKAMAIMFLWIAYGGLIFEVIHGLLMALYLWWV